MLFLTRLTPVIINMLFLVGVLGLRDLSISSRIAVSATDSTPLITIISGTHKGKQAVTCLTARVKNKNTQKKHATMGDGKQPLLGGKKKLFFFIKLKN